MHIKERVFERWVASGTDQTFEEWRESKRHARIIVTGSMRASFSQERFEQQFRQQQARTFLEGPSSTRIVVRALGGLLGGLFG